MRFLAVIFMAVASVSHAQNELTLIPDTKQIVDVTLKGSIELDNNLDGAQNFLKDGSAKMVVEYAGTFANGKRLRLRTESGQYLFIMPFGDMREDHFVVPAESTGQNVELRKETIKVLLKKSEAKIVDQECKHEGYCYACGRPRYESGYSCGVARRANCSGTRKARVYEVDYTVSDKYTIVGMNGHAEFTTAPNQAHVQETIEALGKCESGWPQQ